MTRSDTSCRQRALKALADLPPFPPVLDRLLATLSSESATMAKISDLIEQDIVIAGNVLKVVNSSFYGRQGTVNSVRRAAVLLGIDKLRSTISAMSMGRVWASVRTAPGWSMARFNRHSVACGLMCDCVAQRVPVAYAEGAFAAGLFHDIGALLIAIALQPEFEEIQALHRSGFGSRTQCELEVIGVCHGDLSAEALETWNLPAAIQQAVRYHHHPQRERDIPAGFFGLALTVQCADAYIEANNLSLLDTPEPPATDHYPLAPLGIDSEPPDLFPQLQAELDALVRARSVTAS